MKKLLLILTILAAGLLFESMAATSVKTNYKFAESSLLSTGKWVRVAIGETGLYELTYDELRGMGFADPSKVTVFGQGGAQLQLNFLSSSGQRLYEDNPVQVATIHRGGKLFFYAYDTTDMTVSNVGYKTTERVRLRRNSKNIYSDKAYYLLTDSQSPLEITTHSIDDKSAAADAEFGYSFIYHELDLEQSKNRTGQLYWGERLAPGVPIEFEVNARYCVEKPAYLFSQFAIEGGNSDAIYTYVNNGYRSLNASQTTSATYTLGNDNADAMLKVDSEGNGSATVKFVLGKNFDRFAVCALDYWTLSYPVNLGLADDDPNFNAIRVGFNSGIGDLWRHPLPAGCIALDVTGHKTPEIFDSADGYFYHDKRTATEAVVFNPDRTQRRISEWTALENQNLHALAKDGVDFVILASGQLLPYAQRIAAAHERTQGIRAIALDPQLIFNEFNCGIPDVTAIRAFVKMLFHNAGHPIRNLLFLGPVYGDYRNVAGIDRPLQGHIAFQQPEADFTSHAMMNMDMYGMITDFYSTPDVIRNAPISVGVGILPVSTVDEAENCVRKINEQLEKEDMSGLVNETMVISCPGDNYLHTMQSAYWADMLRNITRNNFSSTLAENHVWIEKMGTNLSDRVIKDCWNNGKLLTAYYGHAGGGEFNCINTNDVLQMDNRDLGFLFLAACDLCEPDQQRHGIGDIGVLRSKRGFAGTICATRSVIASENNDLCRAYHNSLFYGLDGSIRTSTPTIGKAYADAKYKIATDGEASYVLIGDPALEVPVALAPVKVSLDRKNYRAGDVMTVTGEVQYNNMTPREDYNGFVTVKVMEPEHLYTYVDTLPKVRVSDLRLATVKGEVRNGRFTVRVPLDKKLDNLMSTDDVTRELTVMVGTYDPTLRLGASGYAKAPTAVSGTESSPSADSDKTPPTVSLSYDPMSLTLSVNAADETAMIPGVGGDAGTMLTVDGRQMISASTHAEDTYVTSGSYPVSVAHLPAGTHTATVKAVDVCGNSSEELTLEFTIAESAPLTLTKLSEYGIDEISFQIGGELTDGLVLTVADRQGHTLLTEDVTSSRHTIDTSEFPVGHYTASLRHNSPAGAFIYSNRVNFTVIE